MITDIFEYGYGNYTFYAHNLARFDGHFITNSLLVNLPNYENFEDVRLIVGDYNDLIQAPRGRGNSPALLLCCFAALLLCSAPEHQSTEEKVKLLKVKIKKNMVLLKC